MPKAGPDQVVIRNKAIAINPVDWKIQDYGAFVQKWPMILGTDVAGDIVEVGENVKNLKKGDRVAAYVHCLNMDRYVNLTRMQPCDQSVEQRSSRWWLPALYCCSSGNNSGNPIECYVCRGISDSPCS